MLRSGKAVWLGLVLSLPWAAPHAAGYRIETIASGLEHPWSLAFLPEGDVLVTERAGRLRLIEDGALRVAPVAGVPPVLEAVTAIVLADLMLLEGKLPKVKKGSDL